jgi:hypothetical protein
MGEAAQTREISRSLEAVCCICEEGEKLIAPLPGNSVWLLHQVEEAVRDEQLVVLKWLCTKFEK